MDCGWIFHGKKCRDLQEPQISELEDQQKDRGGMPCDDPSPGARLITNVSYIRSQRGSYHSTF